MKVDHLLRACTLVQSVNILRYQCVNFAQASERREAIVICIGRAASTPFQPTMERANNAGACYVTQRTLGAVWGQHEASGRFGLDKWYADAALTPAL